MRRDIFYTYDKPVAEVFNAYQHVIKSFFNKGAEVEPIHTITFGLSFSFKYNMNGGACHVHFIRSGKGTAVGIRYSIAQLMGARYEAHGKDMARRVEELLGVPAQSTVCDMEEFLKPENMLAEGQVQPQAVFQSQVQAQPEFEAQPMAEVQAQPQATVVPPVVEEVPTTQEVPVAPVQQRTHKFCTQCGEKIEMSARFCVSCGAKQEFFM